MGLYSDNLRDEENVAWCGLGREELCFYCGRELGDTGIYWSAGHVAVFLHPPCAQMLGTHLIKDVARWEKFSHKYVAPRANGNVPEKPGLASR